ncbi:hypothetical protein [Sphingomonas sp.]|uniref:hypothetical protein n=1 Tax=Sphingomonas sp. TaxID=28214 RepID=UPI0025EE960D|nr:hypothetical protein [Sphingomonas sp.]
MHGDDQDAARGEQSDIDRIGQPATIIVRAWLEPRADGPPVLRGTVAELGGRMLGAFTTVERLAELVAGHVDIRLGSPPGPDESNTPAPPAPPAHDGEE